MCGARRSRAAEFGSEQVGRGSAILAPPLVDGPDLRIRLRRGSDSQAHCRRRSSSRISPADRRLPASPDFQDAESASCKACRSSLVRSSPSSSATRSSPRVRLSARRERGAHFRHALEGDSYQLPDGIPGRPTRLPAPMQRPLVPRSYTQTGLGYQLGCLIAKIDRLAPCMAMRFTQIIATC
jgi:hypothetical protein